MIFKIIGATLLQLVLSKFPPERLLNTKSLVNLTYRVEEFKRSVERRKKEDRNDGS
jgi:hypothetical protein